MDAIRRARIESVIIDEISRAVSRELKDPRVPSVTFTAVELTPDGKQAKIFFSILGGTDDAQVIRDCAEGLNSAAGFLRKFLGKALTVRHIPTLYFKEDRGFDNAIRVHQLLKEIKKGENDVS